MRCSCISDAETPYPYQFLTHWQGLAHQRDSPAPIPLPITLQVFVCMFM